MSANKLYLTVRSYKREVSIDERRADVRGQKRKNISREDRGREDDERGQRRRIEEERREERRRQAERGEKMRADKKGMGLRSLRYVLNAHENNEGG
jgi:hypothetical protein